ncbi:MAG TPA: YceI family protein [Rubricoccaceae bacterium]
MPPRAPSRLLLRTLLSVLLALVTSGALAQTTYRVDTARSTVAYAMSHPAHDWTGTSRAVAGALTVGPDGSVTAASVSAPVRSFDSGNRNRDSHMVEATEAYVHRNVTFQLSRLTPMARPTATANAMAAGALTFHGVRRAVTLPVRMDRAPSGLRVRGTFEVTLTEFGVDRPALLGVRVRDWIELTFDLAFRRS